MLVAMLPSPLVRATLPVMECSVPDCGNEAWARGWCPKHYQRWRTHGDPTITNRRPLEERFFDRVQKADDGCWLWTGFINHGGYGRFSISHTQGVMAHRWAYEHWVGPIPDGLTIDHLCRVTRCVNPEHLEPVTIQVNEQRAAAHNATKTHCKHGHEFTPENTRVLPNGRRECRACRDEINWRSNIRKREKRRKARDS